MRYTEEQKKGFVTLHEKIKEVKFAMLTTMDRGRNSLHSRPMATLTSESDEDTLWFFTYANSEKADEIGHHAQVNVNYADPGHDCYISVSGTAEIVKDLDLIKEKWSPILQAWFPDGYHNPQVALLKVSINEAEYWDSDASKMVKMINMVRAILTGKEADMDTKHEKIDFRKD